MAIRQSDVRGCAADVTTPNFVNDDRFMTEKLAPQFTTARRLAPSKAPILPAAFRAHKRIWDVVTHGVSRGLTTRAQRPAGDGLKMTGWHDENRK